MTDREVAGLWSPSELGRCIADPDGGSSYGRGYAAYLQAWQAVDTLILRFAVHNLRSVCGRYTMRAYRVRFPTSDVERKAGDMHKRGCGDRHLRLMAMSACTETAKAQAPR